MEQNTESEIRRRYERLVLWHLKHAYDRRPLTTVGFEEVLDDCYSLVFPSTETWFHQQVLAILANKKNDNGSPRWGDLDRWRIIRAATKQLSAQKPEYRTMWLGILLHQEFSDYALEALGSTQAGHLHFLDAWWRVKQIPLEKLRHLRDVILFVISDSRTRNYTEDELLIYARHEGRAWSMDLRMEVNRIFEAEGIPLPFPAPDAEAKELETSQSAN